MPSRNTLINTKELRSELPRILARVRRGQRFTVLYRSHPAFQIIPIDAAEEDLGPLADDPFYKAGPICRTRDGKTSQDHDEILYGWKR